MVKQFTNFDCETNRSAVIEPRIDDFTVTALGPLASITNSF